MNATRLSKEEVKKVLEKGETWTFPLFRLKTLKNGLSYSRISIVVSKKEEKTAVGRNRIRRRMREALKKVLRNKDFSADLVIFAKKEAKTLPFLELESKIKASLSRF